jgi:hypothetical protein
MFFILGRILFTMPAFLPSGGFQLQLLFLLPVVLDPHLAAA